MASSPPLVATAPAGGRAPSPSRPSLAEPPPGQPAAPESAARMWAVGQPSGPCGAGRPAWEPGSSPRVAASSPGRDVTGQLCLDRSQGRVGGTGPSPHADRAPPVSLVPGPTPRHDVANGSRKGPLCKSPGHRQWRRGLSQLRRARAGLGSGHKTDRRVGPRPLAPGAIWPSCSWLSSAQPCVAQSLAPAPFSARRGEGGVTPGRAPPPTLRGLPLLCVRCERRNGPEAAFQAPRPELTLRRRGSLRSRPGVPGSLRGQPRLV